MGWKLQLKNKLSFPLLAVHRSADIRHTTSLSHDTATGPPKPAQLQEVGVLHHKGGSEACTPLSTLTFPNSGTATPSDNHLTL